MVILTLCLLPAAETLPNLLSSQREIETKYQLSLVAQEKVDDAVLALLDTFAAGDVQGDLAAQGHPGWRYHIVVAIPAAGQGRYATVCSQAWVDKDSNGQCDTSETQVRFDTLVANHQWKP
jgi:hypothetical protein